MKRCSLCGQEVFTTIKPGGTPIACDFGKMYFTEDYSLQGVRFRGEDGKVRRGRITKKKAGAVPGLILHGETCEKLKAVREKSRNIPYVV